MNTQSRIASILNAISLRSSITGFPTFSLAELNLSSDLDFQLPSNVRLGHLAEKVVSRCIESSTNYTVLYENIQIVEDKKTIGEIDFIVQNKITKQVVHLELAYKFYLLDPHHSSEPINNWIGPNRNDSLQNKLDKLKKKQFPLLQHHSAASILKSIKLNEVSQALCLLASLFLPYGFKGSLHPDFAEAVKGYYLDLKTFMRLDHSAKTYYIPSKKEWGMKPTEDENWTDLIGVEKHMRAGSEEQQALLYWENINGVYATNFIVWW